MKKNDDEIEEEGSGLTKDMVEQTPIIFEENYYPDKKVPFYQKFSNIKKGKPR
jgi:hypothetical protein